QELKENSLVEFKLDNEDNPYNIYKIYKSSNFFKNKDELLNFKAPDIDYIIFLDSDDYWELNCIEECVPRMDGVEVVWFDYYFYYDDIENPKKQIKTILEDYQFKKSETITSKQWLEKTLENNFTAFWLGQMCMINFIQFLNHIKLKFINGIIHEDHHFGMLLCLQANKIYINLNKLYIYRVRPNSIMNYNDNGKNINKSLKNFCNLLNLNVIDGKKYYKILSYGINAFLALNFSNNFHNKDLIKLFNKAFKNECENWIYDIIAQYPTNDLRSLFIEIFRIMKNYETNYENLILDFIAMIINNNKITIVKQSNEIQNNQNTIKIYCEKINSQNNIILQQTNQIHNLNTTLENKNQLLITKENLLNFQNNYGKAKTRVQNQLSYKLGQALILNSKSVLGFLSLPFIILSIIISHKQEQKAYKFKVKKNPNLALPPLETYPDYNEALKEKECFTYKLGEALIQASKNWYGGGYIKFWLIDIQNLKRKN
ncbi:glycosyltransferase family 2 protein, partial [Campylobacter jejuni]|nr:glycosyltransferase family 2 protein [Campylobacter jejuni]HEF7789354.1 glycosyltransferase family 2 protein [Campylobacter jejuni]